MKKEMLLSIISEMQSQNAAEKSRRDAAYFSALENKEFEKADKKVRELTIAVSAGKATMQQLDKCIKLRDELLGYKPSTPQCAKCHGTGYHGGKICPCVFKQYTQILTKQSGFKPNPQKNFSTDIFKDAKTKNDYKKVYQLLDKYCDSFPVTKNLVLVGGTGTGKTHAAQILAGKLIERGHCVLYLTAFALIERFKNFISNFNSTETDALFDCDLLIIDDLGTEPKIRNITQEYLYNVINERITRESPFLITTNLSPDDLLAQYDQRLASRILAKEKSIVIEMKSPDLRLQ